MSAPAAPRGPVSTLDGAAARRAMHVRYERPPVFNDTWAIKLIAPKTRWTIRIPFLYRRKLVPGQKASMGIFASALCCFQTAEETVERGVAEGVGQYLILGAGLDSFALRRRDLADRLRVFELDHPASQQLKRARVVKAIHGVRRWPSNLELVPVDFESTSIPEALAASSFDPAAPSVVSWLNTTPYITKEGIEASLRGLHAVMTPGSRLVFNYAFNGELDDRAREALEMLKASVVQRGEPFRSRYDAGEMEAVLDRVGFDVEARLTNHDFAERYFKNRTGELYPFLPAALIIARRRGE